MIVLDTSAAVELLLSLPLSRAVAVRLEESEWQVAAPQLLVIEVAQVLRRRVGAGITSLDAAEEAFELLDELNPRYYDNTAMARRIWELRDNLTAYDACYVALAEELDAVLLTSDSKLANAPGNSARIELVS